MVFTRAQPPSTIGRFSKNLSGRDFVIGDVHGAFESVKDAMQLARFDPATDRLFCTGDLVDRHPNSRQVIAFLEQPFVFASQGNHDYEFISMSISRIREIALLEPHRMGWTAGVSCEDIFGIQDRLRLLPLAMEVETHRGNVGLVHADIPRGMSWPFFLQLLDSGHRPTIDIALFGRDRIAEEDHRGVRGVGRVFVGHTVQTTGPRGFGNVCAIDTGAVFRELHGKFGSLTMLNIACDLEFSDFRPGEDSSFPHIYIKDRAGVGGFDDFRTELPF